MKTAKEEVMEFVITRLEKVFNHSQDIASKDPQTFGTVPRTEADIEALMRHQSIAKIQAEFDLALKSHPRFGELMDSDLISMGADVVKWLEEKAGQQRPGPAKLN